jgi:UDP-glucose:(heptosyl)LPS alpha-1,3-glucosyltransferase
MGRDGCGDPLLVVAGGDKKAAKYKGLARKLDIESSVVFAGSIANVSCALSIADAAVLPTFSDACSRFVLEAVVFEKPVITTRYNGAADFIADTKAGVILNDPGDVDELADALGFFGNSENRQAAAKDIQNRKIKDIISIKRHVDELMELYEKILNLKAKK